MNPSRNILATFGINGSLRKYSFNAKELDEETGMYYYEARYYKPPVFTSRDAMMNQKNFSETIAYQYYSPSIEQQIVKNMCKQYAHIVGSTSIDIGANIIAYSSPTNRIPNRYQNATSLAVAIGYCVWLNYNITHPEQLE